MSLVQRTREGDVAIEARSVRLGNSALPQAAAGGVIGIRLNGGDGVFVCEIYDADQDYDPERNGQRLRKDEL